MNTWNLNRRQLISELSAAIATIAPLTAQQSPSRSQGGLQRRPLGKTGQSVSCLGLGGSHIGKPKVGEDQAIRLIRSALDHGLNFMDNSWDYNDGISEERMGKALQDGYRQKAFLMTKFDGREKQSATEQIDESLKRLQTDHLDLLQYHEVIRFDDVDRFFAPGGAAEALVAARKSGKTRFIGFTGHKDPRIHLYMLETADKNNFHFDTVQMPLNVMDAHFRSFAGLVVPEAQKRGLGILGMKSLGSGVILKSNAVTAEQCLQYALSLPTSTVITGIDSEIILQQALRVGSNFQPLDQQQLTSILQKVAPHAAQGKYELFKTSSHFDSTALHPEWLGEETEQVKALGAQG